MVNGPRNDALNSGADLDKKISIPEFKFKGPCSLLKLYTFMFNLHSR